MNYWKGGKLGGYEPKIVRRKPRIQATKQLSVIKLPDRNRPGLTSPLLPWMCAHQAVYSVTLFHVGSLFTCLHLSAICHFLQRHWPGAVREAADRGRPAAAVSGLQEHAAGRGCPRCPPGLPRWCPGRPAAPGRGLGAVGAHCCSGDQSQVPTVTGGLSLFMHCSSWLDVGLNGWHMFFHRYSRIDFLYLNAGIMPNPQVNVKAFFKGLFSR